AYDNPSPYSAMDYLKYHYNKKTNQLNYVTDTVRANKWSQDIDNESPNNYLYDSIGELTKDTANGIKRITWTVYGKVQSVKKYNGDSLYFVYDAMQNRIEKIYLPNGGSRIATFYERDAQGNIIATYSRTEDATNFYFTETEEPIYGSDRLGEFKENIFVKSEAKANYDRGPFWMTPVLASQSINIIPVMTNVNIHVLANGQSHIMQVPFSQRPVSAYSINVPNTNGHYYRKINDKVYELKDHLGDVRVTVSDRKDSLDNPNMLSYNNNYAFGMAQPSRTYNLGSYRFGFNTQEMDNEIYGNANAYTTEFRELDPRLGGRWWSRDPLIKPWESPYAGFANNPIVFVDPSGLDTLRVNKDKLPEKDLPPVKIVPKSVPYEPNQDPTEPSVQPDLNAKDANGNNMYTEISAKLENKDYLAQKAPFNNGLKYVSNAIPPAPSDHFPPRSPIGGPLIPDLGLNGVQTYGGASSSENSPGTKSRRSFESIDLVALWSMFKAVLFGVEPHDDPSDQKELDDETKEPNNNSIQQQLHNSEVPDSIPGQAISNGGKDTVWYNESSRTHEPGPIIKSNIKVPKRK